jgi:hypothetical protein
MANEVLIKNGTSKTFKSSGGDVTFTPTSLANGAGRLSAVLDLGATRAGRYRIQVTTDFNAAPTAGNPLEVYLVRSDDNTVRDGALGSADAAVSDGDIRAQCLFCGILPADNTTTTQTGSFEVETGARYVSVLWWNASGQALSGTAGDHSVTLTPIITEIQ